MSVEYTCRVCGAAVFDGMLHMFPDDQRCIRCCLLDAVAETPEERDALLAYLESLKESEG